MTSVRVTTWNVLHRVHAVNWKEAPVTAFPSEEARIVGISAAVKDWLEAGVSIVGLQEVSGDQLASLRRMLSSSPESRAQGATIFEHTYPRVPRIRGPEPMELADATEHLVAIVRGRESSRRHSMTFDTDPGKGFLAIDVDDVRVVVTHVSAHERGPEQMNALAAFAREGGPRAIVMGDFNAPLDAVRSAFGASSFSDVAGQLPTRIPTSDHEGRTIDHVIAIGGVVAPANVLEGRLLSDHNPVTATITFP